MECVGRFPGEPAIGTKREKSRPSSACPSPVRGDDLNSTQGRFDTEVARNLDLSDNPAAMRELSIRAATPEDVCCLVELIRSLAERVGRGDELAVTEIALREALFGPQSSVEAIVAILKTTPIAFILFSRNFASFSGHPGFFIEDIFVHEDYRREGIGSSMMKAIARLAQESGCRRIDWFFAESNQEAIAFWCSVGAVFPNGRRWFRLMENPIASLAE